LNTIKKEYMINKILNRIIKLYRDTREFYKRGSKPLRFLKYFASFIILLLILTAAAAEYTSRPAFCPTCHYMETFYQSWRTSAHNKVDCVECHFEPGISGTVRGKLNGLVQIVNYISLSYKKRKPWAEIPDNTCARVGCHETQALKDSTYSFKGVQFNHKHHLQELKRGKTLKCTSCHSQIVQGTHIEVTPSTCFNCHFKKSDDPEHKYDKLAECSTCHDWTKKTPQEMKEARYDHTVIVENKFSCQDCHSNTIVGNGEVGKERCYQCHFETERLDKYNDVEFMHTAHITKHGVRCFNCHSPIQHRIQKLDPSAPPDCKSCHTNAHTSQVSLYTGENGFETEKSPSAMYLNGINCRGCHVFHNLDKNMINTSTAGEKACEKCHGHGYDRLVEQWKVAATKRIATIKGIYNTVSRQITNTSSANKDQAVNLINEADHNIKIVEIGKSVHNVQFADKLLIAAYNIMKKSLTVIGSSANLPEFKSDAEFIPNECYSCHSGIQEISVKKFDMNFSHNQHIAKERIVCNKCHSNAQKHGELIVNKESCNSCHHAKGKNNDACANCHQFQQEVYSGNYLGKKQPDYMKEGGAGCVDCHMEADKLVKPDKKICLKCHGASYENTLTEWKNDVKKLSVELGELIKQAKSQNLSNDEQDELNETKKILAQINSYPSIYVHNYDLISSVLSEKIKILKKYNK